MVAMMNKQLSVYLSNYLVDAGMGKVFVKALIQGSICPVLNHAAGACTRDSIKKTVTTPQRMLNENGRKCSRTRHGIKMNMVLT